MDNSVTMGTLEVPLNAYSSEYAHQLVRDLKTDFVALGTERRETDGTQALDGNCAMAMTRTRQELARYLSEKVRETASPVVVRKVYRDEQRVCADLALSKLVVTELGSDKVLRDVRASEGCKFTLETTDRRLIVSGSFESPSAEEVDSERGSSQYCHRTMVTYAHQTHYFRWQFPLENISAVSVVSQQGTVALASVSTQRRTWIFVVTVLSAIVSFGVVGLTYSTYNLTPAVVFLSLGLLIVLAGVPTWWWNFAAEVSPKIHRQTDATVIEISGTSPQEMAPVKVALTVLEPRAHIGNIDDFFEKVNPDCAPRVSRVPLSEVSHSKHRLEDALKTVE